jgi:hypothetical protein
LSGASIGPKEEKSMIAEVAPIAEEFLTKKERQAEKDGLYSATQV